MKSIRTSSGGVLDNPCYIFLSDDDETGLINGLFDLHIKHLINRRRILRNELKKDFEAEEKAFLSSKGYIDYPYRYTLWEKKINI